LARFEDVSRHHLRRIGAADDVSILETPADENPPTARVRRDPRS
jgi:hypothetical protein